MATLLAHLTIREGAEDRFEDAGRASSTRASHAAEPGLVRYEYLRSAEPRTYYCLLSFTDEAAFLRHQASDHHEAATAELRDLIESIDASSGSTRVGGASPLAPTEAAGPAPDAGPTSSWAYHRRCPWRVGLGGGRRR